MRGLKSLPCKQWDHPVLKVKTENLAKQLCETPIGENLPWGPFSFPKNHGTVRLTLKNYSPLERYIRGSLSLEAKFNMWMEFTLKGIYRKEKKEKKEKTQKKIRVWKQNQQRRVGKIPNIKCFLKLPFVIKGYNLLTWYNASNQYLEYRQYLQII